MRAYYASKISPNLSKTPEGFLICKNVPIARTGRQTYLRRELGLYDRPNDTVTLNRRPEDVFAPETLASFEGKPVTDDHPPSDHVTSDNAVSVVRGVARDIRRGDGDAADQLLADLIIYDSVLVAEIENGKREISCGYDSVVVEDADGDVYQSKITGNHIAVVDAGRAGHGVRIKDRRPINPRAERRQRKMPFSFLKKKSITSKDTAALVARMSAVLHDSEATQDEKEEVVGAVAEALLAQQDEAAATEAIPPTMDDAPTPAADNACVETKTTDSEVIPALVEAVKQLNDNMKSLTDEIAVLKAAPSTADSDPLNQLEQLEQALSDEEGGKPATEQEHIADPETIDEQAPAPHQNDSDGVLIIEPEAGDHTADNESDIVATVDRAAIKQLIQLTKPLIAKEENLSRKRALVDSISKLAYAGKGDGTKGGYVGIARARQEVMTQRASDTRNAVATEAQRADQAQKGYDARRKQLRGEK